MRLVLLPFLAAFLVAGGCGSSSNGVKVFRNPSGMLSVKSGTTFALSLPENSGVGFTWQLTAKPGGSIIETAGDAYSAQDPENTGGGGQHRFVFRARHAGKTVIRLRHYFRGKPRERRAVAVEVR